MFTVLAVISVLLAAPAPGLLLVLSARPAFVAPWPENVVRPLMLEPPMLNSAHDHDARTPTSN